MAMTSARLLIPREYHAIFPGMRISAMKNTQTEVVTTLNGFRLAISVDGTLTGRGGRYHHH